MIGYFCSAINLNHTPKVDNSDKNRQEPYNFLLNYLLNIHSIDLVDTLNCRE